MSTTAEKTDPKLWEKVKKEVTAADKGGRSGQWSARKAQIAVQVYKAKGGQYTGKKGADNHLLQWEREDWGTKSGRRSRDTGERYLPRTARQALSADEYRRTTRKKRRDTHAGKQFSKQPGDVARKTARHRADANAGSGAGGETRAALYRRAQDAKIPGRSHMTRSELARALARHGA